MKKILKIEYPVGFIMGRGMFSILSSVLWQMEWAKNNNIIPFVGKIESPDYCSSEKSFWEQYFLPTCTIENDDIIIDNELIISGHIFSNSPFDDYAYLTKYRGLYQQYIKLNQYMEDELREAKKLLCNKKTLGVHYRGTDKMIFETGSIPLTEYESAILKTCAANGFEQVFIATDEIEALEFFKTNSKNYPFKIIFTDSFRVSKAHESNNFANFYNPNNDQYTKFSRGKEALIDCYLLSECETLIRNRSNMSSFSMICSDNIKNVIFIQSKNK